MLFIGNLLGRIWGFFVVRPSMKKAINDAENSGDFDEYKAHMAALDKGVEEMMDSVERMKKTREELKKRREEQAKQKK